jgi:hypothetical protein
VNNAFVADELAHKLEQALPADRRGLGLSVQPDPLGDEARRAVGGGHGRERQHGHRRPLRAGAGGAVAHRHGRCADVAGAGQRVHRRRVAPPRELAGDEQVLQQGPRLHDGGQQPPLLRQRPLAGEHVERGVGRGAGGRRRGGRRRGGLALVGGGDGVEEGVDGGGDEAAVGVGDAGRDARRRRGCGGEEELLQLVARVVAVLGDLTDEVGELGDALLLPPELLPGRLQLQRRRHEALLQLRHALRHTNQRFRNNSSLSLSLSLSLVSITKKNQSGLAVESDGITLALVARGTQGHGTSMI